MIAIGPRFLSMLPAAVEIAILRTEAEAKADTVFLVSEARKENIALVCADLAPLELRALARSAKQELESKRERMEQALAYAAEYTNCKEYVPPPEPPKEWWRGGNPKRHSKRK